MIFGCLECDAGHNLPVSTIPTGGLDVTCRRCGKAFVAHPDGRVVPAKKDLGVSLVPGGSGDGQHTALDKEGPTEAGVFLDGEATVDSLSAEFDGFDDPTEHSPLDDDFSDPQVAVPKSVHDRVGDGEYVPEPTVDGVSASDPSIKAWNEPSDSNILGLSVVARAALALNEAPLAVKGALLIFPLVLAGTLILTAGVFVEPSIEIPAQKLPTPPKTPLPPLAEVTVPAAPEVPPPEPPDVAEVDFRDRAAPEGYMYTQPRRTRIRAEASLAARPIARLKRGRLVRLYQTRGEWVLVMREPNGPAGFVALRDLAAKKPVLTLAREMAFQGCKARRKRDRPRCKKAASAQHLACDRGCGPGESEDPESSLGRCLAACKLAFTRCAKGCSKRRQ